MAQVTTPDALDQGTRTIGFFTLPRELRDNIYDLVWQERAEEVSEAAFHIQAAIPKARLISRQVKSEYDERSPANSILRVVDNLDDFKLVDSTIPRLATQTVHLSLRLTVPSCECPTPSDIDDSCTVWYMKDLLRSYKALICSLPCLKTTEVMLVTRPDDGLKRVLDIAIKLPTLIKLNVVSYDLMLSGSSLIFAIWTREDGLKLDRTEKRVAMEALEEAEQKHKAKLEAEAVCVEAPTAKEATTTIKL